MASPTRRTQKLGLSTLSKKGIPPCYLIRPRPARSPKTHPIGAADDSRDVKLEEGEYISFDADTFRVRCTVAEDGSERNRTYVASFFRSLFTFLSLSLRPRSDWRETRKRASGRRATRGRRRRCAERDILARSLARNATRLVRTTDRRTDGRRDATAAIIRERASERGTPTPYTQVGWYHEQATDAKKFAAHGGGSGG